MAKKMSFEQSLNRLEEIAKALEDTQTGLEASVKLYSEGVQLAKQCSEMLEDAQQSVELLKESADGTFRKTEFKGEGDESEL